MEFFRRLLNGQAEPKSAPRPAGSDAAITTPKPGNAAAGVSATPPVAPETLMSDPPVQPDAEKGSDSTPPARTALEVDMRPSSGFGTGILGDGVTRPLPEDTSILLNGHEHIAFAEMTDTGMIRANNQDAAFSLFCAARSADEWPDFGLFVVADGMGGHHDGEKASALASRAFATQIAQKIYLPMITGDERYKQTPITEVMVEAALKANADVVSKVPDGGTTLTSVVVIGDLAYVAHVGDSRVYFLQRDKIEQMTRDHSLVQRLIELDQLTADEAVDHPQKNVLYRALGQNEMIEVDTLTRRLPPRSRLLLCSDGLWNQVEDREILQIVNANPDLHDASQKLVALANSRGGLDNVTVILLQLPG